MKRHLLPTAFAAAAGISLIVSACSGGGDDSAAMASAGAPAAQTAAPLAGGGSAASAETAPQLARAEFAVEGMTCGGCVLGTRMALNKLDGVQQADASYDKATGRGAAWAVYDPRRVTPGRMMEAIRSLGYTPTLLTGEA